MNTHPAARARRLIVSATEETKEHAKNLHSYAVMAFGLFILGVLVMWILNIIPSGYGRWAVKPLAFAGIAAMIISFSHPKFLFWAVGLGAVVEGLNDQDITQGSVKGVLFYFKVVSGALFYFTACATVLAIIPFGRAPGTFWGFALVIIMVSMMFAYLNISTGMWMKRIVVTGAIILSLDLAAQLFLPNGVFLLGESSYNALDRAAERRAIKIELCSKSPDDPTCQSQPEEPQTRRTVAAQNSGQMIAPAGRWSDWLEFSIKKCAYMWGEDPNGNRFISKYEDRDGNEWEGLDSGDRFVRARSFYSNTGMPERVNYQLVDRQPNGKCKKL